MLLTPTFSQSLLSKFRLWLLNMRSILSVDERLHDNRSLLLHFWLSDPLVKDESPPIA